MFYSYKNGYPGPMPDRIRLINGLTSTDQALFTDEELALAGYKKAEDPPEYNEERQRISWEYLGETDSGPRYGWQVTDVNDQEKAADVRATRNRLIEEVMWRVYRNNRETRLGLNTTEPIARLDQYIQDLCDVPNQVGFPWEVTWPTLED